MLVILKVYIQQFLRETFIHIHKHELNIEDARENNYPAIIAAIYDKETNFNSRKETMQAVERSFGHQNLFLRRNIMFVKRT